MSVYVDIIFWPRKWFLKKSHEFLVLNNYLNANFEIEIFHIQPLLEKSLDQADANRVFSFTYINDFFIIYEFWPSQINFCGEISRLNSLAHVAALLPIVIVR